MNSYIGFRYSSERDFLLVFLFLFFFFFKFMYDFNSFIDILW